MGFFAAGVLFGLVLLRVVLVGLGATLILGSARSCPACLEPTLLLHRPVLRRVLPWVEWRWCTSCGWHGPSRHTVSSRFGSRTVRGRGAPEGSGRGESASPP